MLVCHPGKRGWSEPWLRKEHRGGDIPVEYCRGAVMRPMVGWRNESRVSGLSGGVRTALKWRMLQIELIWKKYMFTFSHLEFEVLLGQSRGVQ